MSGQVTSRPKRCSRAFCTAGLRNVPPCTTICSPSESVLVTFKTLCSAFLMTEYASPAEISLIEAPSRNDCLTFEFMNTVQRVPRSQGASPLVASFANSAAVYPMLRAKDSTNEQHPEKHASLIFIS